ncbi:MAG: 3-methylcrotonyl-CoA carboxylase alpha [Planctomycetota bacterium]|nr:MAG: 3-methylcrotonyl-CoA carboxylase alpha [Planctomycetota bacterium]
MKKVLIANRGEIACRVARACREAGIASVAVATPPDVEALHAFAADETLSIQSYLDGAELIAAAKKCGADAIHPGYGFLSESHLFADAVAAAGLTWIGPPGAAIRKIGDKMSGKDVAEAAGVPTVPGCSGGDQSDSHLKAEAIKIGFPVLVKASGAGGGKGMRVVEREADLEDAIGACRREAAGGFKDDRLLLEKYLRPVRHVEIQVIADTHGNVLHLGERDCSVQRRHQKVVEESPSPAISPETRAAMGRAAAALMKAAGYVNAGTCEFIVDAAGKYYFLEVNARLQVEHPVTETVTGLDLVRLQLDVAAGRPLPIRQEDVTFRGHAIEVRIYAEDPERDFMPSAGRILEYEEPRGVRIDTGVRPGSAVPPDYDPMLAKLIASGRNRAEAIAAARRALREYAILGVCTNIAYLDAILGHPEFAAGRATTDFLAKHFQAWKPPSPPPPSEVLAAVAASDPTSRAAAGPSSDRDPHSPWRARDAWRNL